MSKSATRQLAERRAHAHAHKRLNKTEFEKCGRQPLSRYAPMFPSTDTTVRSSPCECGSHPLISFYQTEWTKVMRYPFWGLVIQGCDSKEPRERPTAKRQRGNKVLSILGHKELNPANRPTSLEVGPSPAEPWNGDSWADTLTATHKLTLKQRGRVPDPQKLGDKQKGGHKRAQAEIAAYEEQHSDVLDQRPPRFDPLLLRSPSPDSGVAG